jgi:cysteine synthase
MTKDEALDLALKSLEHMLEDAKQERLTVEYWNECVDAITAIKQARALDKMAENARKLGLTYDQNQE